MGVVQTDPAGRDYFCKYQVLLFTYGQFREKEVKIILCIFICQRGC